MKKILFSKKLLAAVLIVLFSGVLFGQFDGGSGTELDPYQISTANHLNNVRNYSNDYFLQTADIDMSPGALENEVWYDQELGWEPVVEFTGSYDGAGHIISNLTINRTSNRQALFAYTEGAVVKNLGLVDVNIYGNSNTAGIIGYQRYGTIVESCFVTGTINGMNYVGGIVGLVYDTGTGIYDSYSGADIFTRSTSSIHSAGGIVGYLRTGEVRRCYTTGRIEELVQKSKYVGAVVGRNSGVVENLYWNSDTTGQLSAMGSDDTIDGYSTVEMLEQQNYTGFDFEDTWSIVEEDSFPYLQWQNQAMGHNYPPLLPPVNLTGDFENGIIQLTWSVPDPSLGVPDGYKVYRYNELISGGLINELNFTDTDVEYWMPYKYYVTADYDGTESMYSRGLQITMYQFAGGSGTEIDPYLIETATQLHGIRYALEYHFKQENSIDLGVSPWSEGEGWLPIGSENTPFMGSYDGNGYRIANMTMNRAINDIGLFGFSMESTLKNINLNNIDIIALTGTHIGGLIGRAGWTEISNVNVTGDIYSHAVANGWGVGGVVGFPDSAEILDSSFIGNITGDNCRLGGISGYHHTGSKIRRCYTAGSINLKPGFEGWFGGLGGLVGNSEGTDIVIQDSYSRMNIYGERDGIGGLIGHQQGYNSSSDPYVMKRCYYSGIVSSNPNHPSVQIGPIAGSWMGQDNLMSTYYDRNVTGLTWCPSGAESRSTDEMTYQYSTNTYTVWNFNTVWAHDANSVYNDGYPILRTQLLPIPEVVLVFGEEGITINQNEATTYEYHARVYDQYGQPMNNETVIWVLEDLAGNNVAEEKIFLDNDGLLTVNPDAGAGTLNLTVVSHYSPDVNNSMVISVFEPGELTEISIVGDETVSIPFSGSTSFQYEVEFFDQHGNNYPEQAVTWDLSGVHEGVIIDENGLLTVDSDTEEGNISILATVADNPLINAELPIMLVNSVLVAPVSLSAINTGVSVQLTWDLPAMRSESRLSYDKRDEQKRRSGMERDRGVKRNPVLLAYNIYRNEVQIAQTEEQYYIDNSVGQGEYYVYYVTANYNYGESAPSNQVEIVFLSVEEEIETSEPLVIEGNYPNPFNPETTIIFSIANESNVSIQIYNQKGQLIRKLVDQFFPAKTHSIVWNGKDDSGKMAASGIYYYHIRSDEKKISRKMMLLK